ncbi:ferrous iron transport protein B [Corynebacterium kozikiae]|uniref:ferrous iron transport protein B n=1 Tax=Corynebacterium kozikiae TaxID=2968469 RepID=UPI00211BF438|nr:ferrous iron transport protein B [Corynebacterium sp. 76QC2CO]MCQ9343254.1 ferrous iron transport protein B [Corynebacterium sp. 76QC2CO]
MVAATCHCSTPGRPSTGGPVIALVGCPNSGKSTLFNALTGAKAQMGNWPGTTVEVSRGGWDTQSQTLDVIDFPGAYSLDPNSPDEQLTRDLVITTHEPPDLVMVAVDASNLERSLYMVAQLLEHPLRVIVALTKNDVAQSRGESVDPTALEAALGVPVVAIDPRRKANLGALHSGVERALEQPAAALRPTCCIKGDPIAERFAWVAQAAQAVLQPGKQPGTSFSEKLDRVALHPVAGPLVFLAAMWLVFQITTTVAAPLQDGLDALFTGPLTDAARAVIPAGILQALLVDGLIGGVGMVLTFAPLMALMFLCLAVLEDSGYMARAAVVTDRVMQAIGLPGKAFIPLIVGFGCNVPAIAATRVLAKPRERLLTALLIPFTSCSARLTVYVMLAATFFPNVAGTVVFAMYLISIGLVVAVGFAMKHTLWRKFGREPLVIDLPEYQWPGPRLALQVMWIRLKGFLRTAGGIIVATVAVVFLLQSTPAVSGYGFGSEDLPPQDSVYGRISEGIAPVFEPAGFGSWSITGTLLTGFVAKEAVISTWAQTYALEEESEDLSEAIRTDFNQASNGHGIAAVWAFMVFLLAYTPCVATLAAQKREIGLKWTLIGVGVQLLTAWALAVAVFQVLKVFL